MLRRLKCWIGLHPWMHDELEGTGYRECKHCHRIQIVRQIGGVGYWITTRVGNTRRHTGSTRKTVRQIYELGHRSLALMKVDDCRGGML